MNKDGQMRRKTWINSCHDIGRTRFGESVSCRKSMSIVELKRTLVSGLRSKVGMDIRLRGAVRAAVREILFWYLTDKFWRPG